MEKQLKCVLMLSLKEMAVRKVATLLMTDSDIVASISKLRILGYHFAESKKEWREIIEAKIKDKMVKLELPESLEKQIIDMVKPIGLQIRRWKECQENYLNKRNETIKLLDSSRLFWTSTGTIDYRKTALELVRCDALDVVERYKLACANCLEDEIRFLWKMLPEEEKLYFYNKVLYRYPNSPSLPFCWPHIVEGDLSSLDCLLSRSNRQLSSFNQWAFERSVENGNRVAVEYFFHKLTYAEREASLTTTVEALLGNRFSIRSKYLFHFRYEKLSDILCYLLASMTPAQQMDAFREHPSEVMLGFLVCPWPDLFLENVGLIWDYLPPSGYSDLLLDMGNRLALSGHCSQKLFREFFVQSPADCKKCFIDQTSTLETPAAQFLSMFLKSEDSASIEVIFRNIDAAERMRLMLSEDVLRVFYLYLSGEWHMMEVCVREATQSKADRNRLKRAFIEYNGIGGVKWENRIFKRLFEFLDGAGASGDKRKKAQKRKMDN